MKVILTQIKGCNQQWQGSSSTCARYRMSRRSRFNYWFSGGADLFECLTRPHNRHHIVKVYTIKDGAK